ALLGGALTCPFLAAPADERHHTQHDRHEQEAPEDRQRRVEPAERERHELDDPPAQRQQRDDDRDQEQHAARPAQDPRAGWWGDVAHQLQDEQLAVRRRRLAELLGGHLEVPGAALGERQRRLGHPPQLQALLRAGRGDRGAEVLARALGVHPLGGAGAEDRLRGGAEAGLGLELLVGPALEPLHRGESALLLDLDLTLLGSHESSEVYDRRRKPVGSGSGSSGLSGRPGSGSRSSYPPGAMSFGPSAWNMAARYWICPRPTPSSNCPPP